MLASPPQALTRTLSLIGIYPPLTRSCLSRLDMGYPPLAETNDRSRTCAEGSGVFQSDAVALILEGRFCPERPLLIPEVLDSMSYQMTM